MNDQATLIEELFTGSKPGWLIIADAGRYDTLGTILPDHLEGLLENADNGGWTNTSEWFHHHFGGEYDLAFFNGGLTLDRLDPSYDEFTHFQHVDVRSPADVAAGGRAHPSETNRKVRAYANDDVADRLNDLGYGAPPMPRNGGIIRYMAPHRPYPTEGDGLPELSQEGGDAEERTRQLIADGKIEPGDVYQAYQDHYRDALDAAMRIAHDLEGRVVLSSDHGELLGEDNRWYHGGDPDPALTVVPWVVLSE